MTDDQQAETGQAADEANEAASDSTSHPESSTSGTLDEEKLREDADHVDEAIQEAKRRNA